MYTIQIPRYLFFFFFHCVWSDVTGNFYLAYHNNAAHQRQRIHESQDQNIFLFTRTSVLSSHSVTPLKAIPESEYQNIKTQPPKRYPIVFFIPLEYYSICELRNWFFRQQRWTSLWNFKILLSEKKFLKDLFDIRSVTGGTIFFFLLHFWLGARVNEGEKNNLSSLLKKEKKKEKKRISKFFFYSF